MLTKKIQCNNLLMSLETKKCSIFYTLNSKAPNPFQKYGEKSTYKYKVPFTLAPGNVTIKAMAMTSDGSSQSSTVTKVFLVYEGEEDYDVGDTLKEVRLKIEY